MNTQVDKPAQTPDNVIPFPGPSDDLSGIQIEIEGGGDPFEGMDLSQHGITIEGQEPVGPPPQQFADNLAKHMSEESCRQLALTLSHAVDEDKASRKDWEMVYEQSLKYLGIKEDSEHEGPWQSSCKVSNTMMLEAIVRYQSRALVKLYPQDGPVKLSVDAPMNYQLQMELARAQKALNAYMRDKMPEHRMETDRLLFSQAQIGFAAKKVYFHPKLNRVTSQFVKAENLVLPYGCDNLETCPRYTELVRRPVEEVKALQRKGDYLDIDLQLSTVEEQQAIEKAKADMVGQDVAVGIEDAMRFMEVYVDLYIEEDQFKSPDGASSPYIVTIEDRTDRIFSIRRNWREQDTFRMKRATFVPYIYVPGDGSYGYGIVHLIGQIASAVTKLTRQLVDAGTLANCPALLRSRSARMKSQEPLAPGELREVDLDPEMLQKAFFQLPFREPSNVLLQLMQGLIEEGKAFSSTADLDISASSQNAPVGTTLALLERQTEVMNAVQSRLHDSFRRELKLIIELMQEFQPDVYQSIFGNLEQMGPISVSPVGDPSSATLSQRLIQFQSVIQMSAQAPQVYDLPALHRSMACAMGLEDAEMIIPDNSKIEPADPIQEAMAIMTGKPVKAFEFQNHQAHIQVHMAMAQDPMYQQMFANDPAAAQKMAALQAHIAEHVAFDYRNQIQQALGTPLPPLGQPQPPQVENSLSVLMAKAADRVNKLHQSQAAQMAAQQQMQDPAYQLEVANLQLEKQKADNKHQVDMTKLQLSDKHAAERNQIELARIAASSQTAAEANAVRIEAEHNIDEREHKGMALDLAQSLLDHKTATMQMDQQAELAKQQQNNQPTGE